MKNVIILIVVAIIIILTGLYEQHYIDLTSKYLISEVEYTKNLIENNRFELAVKQLEEIDKTFDTIRDTWSIFILHDDIEKIDKSVVNLKSFIKLKNMEESIFFAEQLTYDIQNIVHRQKVNIANIF